MDPRLLNLYNRELQFLREMGGEFARDFPKIAGRLGLEDFECADPYVERLLEGMAFLAARIQLRLDGQYPEFTQHLFEIVYPHYVAPTPSMAVVQFHPDPNEGALAGGIALPKGTMLRSQIAKGGQTACRYQLAHEVVLWPLQLGRVEYFSRDEANRDVPDVPGARAGLRFRLSATGGMTFDKLALERLPLFLRGPGELTAALYEQLVANTALVVVRPAATPSAWQMVIDPSELRRGGFGDDQAMLPWGPRSFRGFRLLHEYFSMPERFLFVELGGLGPSVRRCQTDELEVFVFFDRVSRALEHRIETSNLSLFCSPAVNLFPRHADRIHLDYRQSEFHVVPDRTRPLDYEPYMVTEVMGYGDSGQQQKFLPFYASFDRPGDRPEAGAKDQSPAYYTLHRVHRTLSENQQAAGPRSSYIGSELYMSLVDPDEAPYRSDLKQVGIALLCTNRDLPLLMPVGLSSGDFTLELSAPVKSVRCLVGPTRPRPSLSYGTGEVSWRLVNHLSLNYASLLEGGAASLREMLALYANTSEAHIRKQVDGVRGLSARPVTRPVPTDGPLTFARGLEVEVTLDESSFEGAGVSILGSVLEDFFARYVAINSFTQTLVRTADRGEIMRWPARIGRRQVL